LQSSARAIVFGANYSVYTRIVRLALLEKGIAYDLREVDIFAPGGPPAGYMNCHPFARIPAFEHGDVRLYETGAITRYVDDAFSGPRLQPADALMRARMNQAVSILDAYAYRTWVWDIFVERVRKPQRGEEADEAKISGALPRARTCLESLQSIQSGQPWIAGSDLSLADLYALPMLALFRLTPEGRAMLGEFPRRTDWLDRISVRASVAATRSPIEDGSPAR
jgi:glutathione S-transferase